MNQSANNQQSDNQQSDNQQSDKQQSDKQSVNPAGNPVPSKASGPASTPIKNAPNKNDKASASPAKK